jgi:hypothetical protein
VSRYSYYGIGEICHMLKLSPATVRKILEKEGKDLHFKIGKVRRITPENFVKLLSRIGINPTTLGFGRLTSVAWIGRSREEFLESNDIRRSLVGTMCELNAGKLAGVVAIDHELSIADIEDIATLCSTLGVRVSIRLPDDASNMAVKTKYIWLFNGNNREKIVEIFKWLRGLENSDERD